MDNWRSLIDRAISRLDQIGLDERDWTWGGGTVLMLRHQHRLSHDIDIFINDVQYLSYLSPRLNDFDAENILEYVQQGHYVRLEYGEGQIDFLVVAPVFPHLEAETMRLDNSSRIIRTMPDKEILGQKLFYRAAGFTGRDLYDFVSVTRMNPSLLQDNELHTLAKQRVDALEVSLGSPSCKDGFDRVERPSLNVSFEEAKSSLLSWVHDQGPNQRLNHQMPGPSF